MREGLSVLFARAGMEVVGGVGNGREAVRLAQELAPDVVVMDLTMPDMNGIEATRQLRARAPDVHGGGALDALHRRARVPGARSGGHGLRT